MPDDAPETAGSNEPAPPPAAACSAPNPAAQILTDQIRDCRLCADRFAATATRHAPRPVPWFAPPATPDTTSDATPDTAPRILIAGQAPGMQVHLKGRPFDDPSGVRLRVWMGVDPATFWDRRRIAILPMAFCFPGYDLRRADLPPPPLCAATWRARALALLPDIRLTLLVGAHAQRWHLRSRAPLTATVAGWRDHAPAIFPLPHPSWRNTAWMTRNPWFAAETLPALRQAVRDALA